MRLLVTAIELPGRVAQFRAALAGSVDGKLVDLSHRIEVDAQLAIVTDKDADGLAVQATAGSGGAFVRPTAAFDVAGALVTICLPKNCAL